MVVGIPRGLLYYEFETMWINFFKELDIEYRLSPETNKRIFDQGQNRAMDEACLPFKIFLGHVESLIGKCDYMLIPRIGDYGFYDRMCTRYQSTIDVVYNIFRQEEIKILPFNIEHSSRETEFASFIDMGKKLGKKRKDILRAYVIARQAASTERLIRENNLKNALKNDGTKILLVGHKYNTMDQYVGEPIIDALHGMGVEVLMATDMDSDEADEMSKDITTTMPWTFNRELVGAISELGNQVDGIILLSSFNCGPDSMSNEMILRKVHGQQILNLVIDGQEGIAGIETRLESFVDIILLKKRRILND